MQITPADKALAAGFAGQLEPAKKRQFVVTVIRDGHRHEWTEGYTSQQAAQDAGLDFLGTFHGVVSVRPLVELTEAEGARRFPQPLHKDAFTDAWRGWHERAERDFLNAPAADKFAANDARALGMQMNCAGPVGEFDRYHQLGGL